MNFEFVTASRILFGPGTFRQIGAAVAGWGMRALLVTGIPKERLSPLEEDLARVGITTAILTVEGEPTIDSVRSGVRFAHDQGCDFAIGVGGGSTLDTAKAIVALLTNPGDIVDYLEVIGKGQPLSEPPLFCAAVPTTAGTGSEVTRNAVLAAPEKGVKVSLRHPLLLPRLAIVDPELTYSLPPVVTASTGLDALTQLIEPYVSLKANPITDALCREGMMRAARSLWKAYEQSLDISIDNRAAAREDMSIASLFGGLALANAGLGAVHGFAGPLGGMFSAPHGALCARLLPLVMAANLQALAARQPQSNVIYRYSEIAQILTGHLDATAADGVDMVRKLAAVLGIPKLSEYGVTLADIPNLVEKSAKASSMKGNPIQLTIKEMSFILEEAL